MKAQFALLFLSRMTAAGLQALAFILLSRTVTIHTFGWVGVVTSLGGFAMLVSDLGLTAAISRARARAEHELVRGFLRVNDHVSVVLAIVFAAITTLTLSDFAPLAFLTISLVMERNSETQLSVFYADGRRVTPALSIVGRRAIALAVFAALLIFDVDALWAFCLGQVAGSTFSQVIQRFALQNLRADTGKGRGSLADVFRAAWPFWLSSVLNQVRVLDTVVVAALSSAASAGLYSAALKLTSPLLLIPTSMAQVLLPYASRQGADVARATTRITMVFAASYIFLVPLCLFSEELLALLYGPQFRNAAPTLVWMLLGLPVLALSGPLAAILQGRGAERFVALNGAVFSVITIAAMIAGALHSGPVGVAAGLAMASTIRVPVLLARVYRLGRESELT